MFRGSQLTVPCPSSRLGRRPNIWLVATGLQGFVQGSVPCNGSCCACASPQPSLLRVRPASSNPSLLRVRLASSFSPFHLSFPSADSALQSLLPRPSVPSSLRAPLRPPTRPCHTPQVCASRHPAVTFCTCSYLVTRLRSLTKLFTHPPSTHPEPNHRLVCLPCGTARATAIGYTPDQ